MHTADVHTSMEERQDLFLIPDLIAKPLEKIKLQHRAEKYQFKEDRGGIEYIRRNVRRGDTVFDIGAHKAGYLYFFLEQLGTTGKIYAFEPQSVLYKYLLKLKQLFAWNNVTLESAAVSDTPGKALLCIPANHGRHSSPCATIIESNVFFNYQLKEEVKTIPLDEYCTHLKLAPDFIKVDVEGNEFSVFRGAENILRRYRPKILFESEARFVGGENVLATFDFLKHIGYKGNFIMNDAIHPIADFDISYHQDLSTGTYCNNFIFE
jgi:FkbM family methyltransferase